MSDRTDLFKALASFVSALASCAPADHRDDMTLEVGDAAFRALSDAMDAAPHMAAKFMGDKFVLKTTCGRVVIRKRAEPAACWVCGKAAPAAMRLETKDGTVIVHHFCSEAGVVRARHESREAAAKQDRKRQEQAPTTIPTPPMPQEVRDYIDAIAALDAKQTGINSVVRGTPPEETTPPARAHLKGCVLDTDHGGYCDPRHPRSDYEKPESTVFAKMDNLAAKVGAACAVKLDPELKPPSLSPRQALGEALACVERARDLFLSVASDPAANKDVRLAALTAYQSEMGAWGSATTARALLAQQEKPK